VLSKKTPTFGFKSASCVMSEFYPRSEGYCDGCNHPRGIGHPQRHHQISGSSRVRLSQSSSGGWLCTSVKASRLYHMSFWTCKP
jgi:hypothetical protein